MISALAILVTVVVGASPPDIEFIAAAGDNINGLALGNPQGLAVNPIREEFLVADALNDRVVIFDTLGRPEFAFDLGPGRHNPFGVAVNSRDEIVISAMDSPRLWKFDNAGHFIDEITLPAGVLPGRLMVGGDDEILVVNRAGKEIIAINEQGGVTRSYTSNDYGCKPSGVCSFDGELLLISSEGVVATAFGADGVISRSFGEHGRRLQDFSHPTSAIADGEMRLWVVDAFRHHIKRFERNGSFIDVIGKRGTGPGEFFFPVDLKLTPSGRLAVLEKGPGRLQIFRLKYEK
jgi:sugar lactone lactonase YvrE